jgi:hypothetical protein
MRTQVGEIKRRYPAFNMQDIVNDNSRHHIDRDKVAADSARTTYECRIRVISLWRANTMSSLTKVAALVDSRKKSLGDEYTSIMKQIAKANVRTPEPSEAVKIDRNANKNPKLVVQLSDISGSKASAKILMQFARAINTFCDQTPSFFAILRIVLKYVMAEINCGNTAVEFPMERNGYVTDLIHSNIFAIFLRQQSRAFIQVVNSTMDYHRLLERTKELRTSCGPLCWLI